MKYMGYYEGVLTIGDCLGPIIGSVLYQLVGFVCMFMIMGWSHFIYIPLMFITMPKNIDLDAEGTTSLVRNNNEDSAGSEFSSFKLITNRLIIL